MKVPGRDSTVHSRRHSSPSSWCMNCSRGSKPSTVGITGSSKYADMGVSIRAPRKFANRSTVTSASGRRLANPRTYPSTSTESLAKPERGSAFGSMSSVKRAGSFGEAPYTVVEDLTTSLRTDCAPGSK